MDRQIIKGKLVLCFVPFILTGIFNIVNVYGMVFPTDDWEEKTPESQYVDPVKLNEALLYLRDNSGSDKINMACIIRNGYLIWKGNESDILKYDRQGSIASIRKTIHTTVNGLLLNENKCNSMNNLAKDYEPRLAVKYPGVTLFHFATYTSGYNGMPEDNCNDPVEGKWFKPATPFCEPGTEFSYWDETIHMYTLVLTKIANENIVNYFHTRVGSKINLRPTKFVWMTWETVDGFPQPHYIRATAQELAKFGHLILNRGKWEGEQIIPENWVDEAITTHVSTDIPVTPGCRDHIDCRGFFGYQWQNNGIKANGQRVFPDAPTNLIWRDGNYAQYIFILPDWNMVIVRLGRDYADKPTANQEIVWNDTLKMIGEAIIPESNQLQFTSVTPCRIVDTRISQGGAGPIPSGTQRDFIATGLCGVPSGPAKALMINISAVNATGMGNLRAFAYPKVKPFAATLNYGNIPGLYAISNAAIIPICDADEYFCPLDLSIWVSTTTDVVVDVMGYFAAP